MSRAWIAVGAALLFALVLELFRRSSPRRRGARGADRNSARPPGAARASVRPAAPGARPRRSVAPPAGRASSPPPGARPSAAPAAAAPVAAAAEPTDAALPDDDVTRVGRGIPEEEESSRVAPLTVLSAAGRTDVGRKRKINEDTFLIADEHNLFVVADGMGGHAAGDVASQLAVETVARAFDTGVFAGAPNKHRPRRGDELVRAVEMANGAVYQAAQANDAQHGMGTTLVAVRFSPTRQTAYIAHAGDSRCYRMREGTLTQLTRDHTYKEMGVRGAMGDELTRAVGHEATIEVELTVDAAQPGDLYLLCSDGLSKMLSDETIASVLGEDPDIKRTCQHLIAVANEQGGRDNVTVVLLKVLDPIVLLSA